MVRMNLKNEKEFAAALNATAAQVEVATRNIINLSVELLRNKAVEGFRPASGQKTSRKGNTYWDTRPPHEPRPPNPTNRSGALAKSIETDVTRVADGVYKGLVGPTLFYGKILELGEGRLKNKYPFMGNGLKDSRAGIRAIYFHEWAEALR